MRVTIRKLVVLAMGIVVALVIAACGSGTEALTGGKAPSTEATTRSAASSTSGTLAVRGRTEADVLKALSAHARKLAGEGELYGAVLIARDDRVLFRHAYGLADRTRGIPNTVGTRFRIGSMNKMFTAVAILQLVEAGKVKLTAPLGTYLRDYPNREVATKVTIHQLLTHTGGTGDIFGPAFDAHRKELRSLADYVKLYGKRGLEFAPGSRWAYSNYGFILLGVVIER
jgi:D-alanyl-D-alanine carboxypeptidase